MENLAWKKKGDAYYLASPTQELVKLHYELIHKVVFWVSDEVYEVQRSGLWNQRYAVYRNNEEVLSVSHNFWGSKGKINFSDGSNYATDYKYKNNLTLRFLDGESEILSYSVGMENGKRKAIFDIGIALIDAERLLLLATLGMVMFLNIFSEFNDGLNNDLLVLIA